MEKILRETREIFTGIFPATMGQERKQITKTNPKNMMS